MRTFKVQFVGGDSLLVEADHYISQQVTREYEFMVGDRVKTTIPQKVVAYIEDATDD